jgi:hypothetical protein
MGTAKVDRPKGPYSFSRGPLHDVIARNLSDAHLKRSLPASHDLGTGRIKLVPALLNESDGY